MPRRKKTNCGECGGEKQTEGSRAPARRGPRRSPGALPRGAEHRARSAPIPPGFCTFPSPFLFFLPSPPFLFFLPLFFFSIPPLSSLPLSLAWLDQSFGISCRRLPRAAVRPRPGAARFPCRRGSGSAGPTRVPAPVPRVSRRCGGGGARRAERGTARGLGRPGQVRRTGHPHLPLKATSSPESLLPKIP